MTTFEFSTGGIVFSNPATAEEARILVDIIINMVGGVKSVLAFRGLLSPNDSFPSGTVLKFFDESTSPPTLVVQYDVNDLNTLNVLQTVQNDFSGKRVDKVVMELPI